MRSRAIVTLGIGQCVNWGVLYYAFAVLLVPVERDLGVQRWVVAGAFALALLMSAVLAPAVGRLADRDRAPLVMQAGGFGAAAILASWALFPSLPMLYVGWAGLGICMAATLYEPAFALVGRACRGPSERLRALAAVTVFGGLASTLFLPATACLVRASGWRATVLVLAGVLAAATWITRAIAFPLLSPAAPPDRAPASATVPGPADGGPRFGLVVAIFSIASLAGAAFTTNLVPALGERGIAPTTAALLGGLLGVMQLPGRALLMNGRLGGSPLRLILATLVLQGLGFAALTVASSLPAVAVGIMVFAAGAGLGTLVRPYVVQTIFSTGRAGCLNGQLARSQQLARAAGPILVAWLAPSVGYGAVFAVLALVYAGLAAAAQRGLGPFASQWIERSHHDRPSHAATIVR